MSSFDRPCGFYRALLSDSSVALWPPTRLGTVELDSNWTWSLIRWQETYFLSSVLWKLQAVSSWNVGFQYGVDVSLEAWKGDIIKHNRWWDQHWSYILHGIKLLISQSYSLTNKCYNGIVYPCQCLEIGFLIRYKAHHLLLQPLFRYSTELLAYPNATFTFNGSPAPTCSSQPDCSTGTVPGGSLLNVKDIALSTVTTTTTTTTTTKDLGCNSKSTLCPGYDQVCQIPEYNNCAYCAGFSCLKGQPARANFPTLIACIP